MTWSSREERHCATENPADHGIVEIGRDTARAIKADERHRRELGSPASPLHGVSYDASGGALDLHRFVESPIDATVRGLVCTDRPHSPDRRAELRACLTMDDFYTLLAFARRSALAALRSGDPLPIRDGLTALTAIDGNRVDHRDVSVAAALLSYAGTHDPAPFRNASAHADQTVSEILLGFAKEPVEHLGDWGYREVITDSGRAFFEDNGRRYEPTADLARLALHVAALIEEDVYRVRSIGVGDDLPDVWLRGADRDAVSHAAGLLAGCAAVRADLDPAAHPHADAQRLIAFVAEAANDADAALLSMAATPGGSPPHEALGLRAGNLCCVVIARSFVEGTSSFEKPDALERFSGPLSKLLEGKP